MKYRFLIILSLFCIISTAAQTVKDELPRRGFVGAQVALIPDDLRAQLKLPAGKGIQVLRVDPQSSAEEAGLKAGDVILRLNNAEVNSPNEFIAMVRPIKAGDKFQLTILRDGKEQAKTVLLKPRPVETNPNFDILYRSVEMSDGRRRVIVTKPKAAGKYPAVLMVGGVGCYSLDNLTPTNAYGKILYGLTQNGFVTMRVEKSGMGDSEGAPCQSPQVDMRREVEGYVAGLRALKKYDFVDANKTFIFGHSIGGIVGPAVAVEEPVAGLVIAETSGQDWFEYALENYRRQALLRGAAYDEAERETRVYRACKYKLWVEKQTPEQVAKENPACADFVRDPAPYTYMQQIAEANLAELWKKVNAPTLIIYGSSDFLTSAREHEMLRDMINSFHPGKATYVEIPQMDHWFYRAASQRASMENQSGPQSAPPQFVEQVFTETLNWLKRNLSGSADVNSTAAQSFTAQDFQNLRWLEGDWRGSDQNGKNPFYERYSFAGKDRIEMQSFADAAMTQPGSEKSVTFLKDGAIYHQAGLGVWVADKLSKNEISFAPKENARNSFVWKMESPDIWTAEINFTNREGQPVRNIYRLERIKK